MENVKRTTSCTEEGISVFFKLIHGSTAAMLHCHLNRQCIINLNAQIKLATE
jgi:hypothetical protein